MPGDFEQPEPTSGKEPDPKVKILSTRLWLIEGIRDVKDAFESGEVNQETMVDLFKTAIIHYRFNNLINYLKEITIEFPSLYKEIFSSPELQAFIKEKTAKALGRYSFSNQQNLSAYDKEGMGDLKQIWEYFSFSEEDIKKIVKDGIVEQLTYSIAGSDDNRPFRGAPAAKIISEILPLDESFVSSVVISGLLHKVQDPSRVSLTNRMFREIAETLQVFDISQETAAPLQEAILDAIQEHGIEGRFLLKVDPLFFPKIFQFLESQKKGGEHIKSSLENSVDSSYFSMSEFKESIELVHKFRDAEIDITQEPKVIEGAEKVLLARLQEFRKPYTIEAVLEVKKNFAFSDGFLSSKEYHDALKKFLVEKLSYGSFSYESGVTEEILKFSKEFDLSLLTGDKEVSDAVRTLFAKKSLEKSAEEAKELLQVFNIPVEEVLDTIQEKLKILALSNTKSAAEIWTVFSLGQSSGIFENTLKPIIVSELTQGHFSMVLQWKKAFNLADHLFTEIDGEMAKIFAKKTLLACIRHLGNEEIEAFLPKTMLKIREMIFDELEKNEDLADYFLENLANYYQEPWVAENIGKAIQHYSVARKFIYAEGDYHNPPDWKNEPWVNDVWKKAKDVVNEHDQSHPEDLQEEQEDEYEYRHGSEGFSKSDPYENHPWRFGKNQIMLSTGLTDILRDKNIHEIVVEKRSEEIKKKYTVQVPKASKRELEEWQQDVDDDEVNTPRMTVKEIKITITPELQNQLELINEKIKLAHQNFLEQIRSNPNIKDEDKNALLNPGLVGGVQLVSLLDNARSFVARYLVQSIEGDVTRLTEIGNLSAGLDRILADGFNRYIKIHEVDVPLYDKLYEEFDNLRETGRYPLEVYLGRDGIYAWVGRRAQDVARRRKMGLEGRSKLKEAGEVIEIHPHYTVYPRYFRDNLNYETKRQFLEQEGISPDADPLFYDTGYTGTIPEQIMRVMDFDEEDIERRIRLLSAPSIHRRVKGIPEHARAEVIEYIEHNSKVEEVAEGLIIDEKTGKIRHIARPTNPEEQFYFMMSW